LINLRFLKTRVIDEAVSLLNKHWVEPKHLEYFKARTIDEAVFLLDEYKEAKIIAGGVDLSRLMRSEVVAPKVLVNIGTIPDLAYIREDAEGLKIGSLATINDLEISAIIRGEYSLLAEAAHSVSSPQIRNMATIGGNLCQAVNCWYYRLSPVTGKTFFCYRKGGTSCYAATGDNRYHAIISGDRCHAVCQSDMAPALLALDAKVKIASPSEEKIIPLEEFYTPLGNILKPNELITELQVPALRHDTKQRYLKFRLRNAIDPAISSVAAAITTEYGRVSQARIVLGGVAPTPYRSIEAEDALTGRVITEGVAETAAKAAVSKAIPLSMNAYKLPITKALVKRAIVS
jgi:xanthine dehydrogenase YagS FAD-binding subunit